MSNVKVAYSDVPADVAVQLLAAAERLDLEPGVVETSSDGVFYVPEEVAKEAKLDYESDEVEDAPEPEAPAKAEEAPAKDEPTSDTPKTEDDEPPAKKAAAKKAPAKKTAAKKTAAKKTTSSSTDKSGS